MREEVSFHMFLKKMASNYLEKETISVIEEEEAPVEFASKVEERCLHFFYQAIEIVVDCILNRFQQKDHIETL